MTSSPDFESGVVIHIYLETFMIEWDGTGVSLTEVVLMSDFDANESAIFVGGLGSDA